jgi:hypothetical protein
MTDKTQSLQDELDQRYAQGSVLMTKDGSEARLVSLTEDLWSHMWEEYSRSSDRGFKAYRPLTMPETIPFLIEEKVDPSLELDTATDLISDRGSRAVVHGSGVTTLVPYGYAYIKTIFERGETPGRRHLIHGWDILALPSSKLAESYDYCALIKDYDTCLGDAFSSATREGSKSLKVTLSAEDLRWDLLFVAVMGGKDLAEAYLSKFGQEGLSVEGCLCDSHLSIRGSSPKLTRKKEEHEPSERSATGTYHCLMITKDLDLARAYRIREIKHLATEQDMRTPVSGLDKEDKTLFLKKKMDDLVYRPETITARDIWEFELIRKKSISGYRCSSEDVEFAHSFFYRMDYSVSPDLYKEYDREFKELEVVFGVRKPDDWRKQRITPKERMKILEKYATRPEVFEYVLITYMDTPGIEYLSRQAKRK